MLLYWLPPLGWAGLIYALSASTFQTPSPVRIPHLDKLVHAALFGILAALLYRALRGERRWRPAVAGGVAFLLTVAYGGLDEFHQWFVPGRHVDPWDLAADGFGAGLGVLACLLLPLGGRNTGSRDAPEGSALPTPTRGDGS